MEFLLDTANIEKIKKYCEFMPVSGVTTNPSILSKENDPDFWGRLYAIREIIGQEGALHVQITGSTAEENVKEAELVAERLGRDTYIKVPVNRCGLKTMKLLKAEGFRITATAVFSAGQAMLAGAAGADYVAPYFNRMGANGIDSVHVISDIAELYAVNGIGTKIVAASFRSPTQIMDAMKAGAHAVTAAPEHFDPWFGNSLIDTAVGTFDADWRRIYGDRRIYELG